MRALPLVVSWVVAAAALAGCGSSVADADVALPARAQPVDTTPFCTAARANSDAIQPLNTLASLGGGAQDLAATVAAVRSTDTTLLTTAPAEIRDDVERTVAAVNRQLDVLVAGGGDSGALSRDPGLVELLNSPELRAADGRYGSYVARNCRTRPAAD